MIGNLMDYDGHPTDAPRFKLAQAIFNFIDQNIDENEFSCFPRVFSIIDAVLLAETNTVDDAIRYFINEMKRWNEFCDKYHPNFSRYDVTDLERLLENEVQRST